MNLLCDNLCLIIWTLPGTFNISANKITMQIEVETTEFQATYGVLIDED